MDENEQRGREGARRAGESELRAPSPGHAPPSPPPPHHPPHSYAPYPPPPPPPPNRVTNFFIDNILRPDFGRKKPEEGVLRRNESSVGQPGESGQVDQMSTENTSTPHADTVTEDEPLNVRDESKEQCLSPDSELLSQPNSSTLTQNQPMLWPAWVYCTRYSDRPSAGPRTRRPKKKSSSSSSSSSKEDKRPRTAFTAEQLQRLKEEFQSNRYLTEQRRQSLANELGLNESQIKIWFQNKRAKIKKASGIKNTLALHLMAQGLYNHATTTNTNTTTTKDDKSDSD